MALTIVIDRDIPFIRGVLEPWATVHYREGRAIRRDDLLHADALITRTRTRCSRELLEGTAVRFIASATIGFDHIDTSWCEGAGIHWTNAPGCNSSSVRQYVAAALDVIAAPAQRPLEQMTIGIIGVGHVGMKVAAYCESLGMRVLLNDPPRERREGSGAFVTLDRIVHEADILTLHVPLNRTGPDRTLHLFDAALLSQLRPHQFLINSSRGEVVETQAAAGALRARAFAGCVLDVWEHEPAIDAGLLTLAAIATPHIAGYSVDGKANGTAMCVQALARHFGLPPVDWFPTELPVPPNPRIAIDARGRTAAGVAREAVRRTYDIMADDRALRATPSAFEALRAGYPVRREFPSWTVDVRNGAPAVRELLHRIGFTTNEDPTNER